MRHNRTNYFALVLFSMLGTTVFCQNSDLIGAQFPVTLNAYKKGQLLPVVAVRADKGYYIEEGKEMRIEPNTYVTPLSSGAFAPGLAVISDITAMQSTVSSGQDGLLTGPSQTTGGNILSQTLRISYTVKVNRDISQLMIAVITYNEDMETIVMWDSVKNLKAGEEKLSRVSGPGVVSKSGPELYYTLLVFEAGQELLTNVRHPNSLYAIEEAFFDRLMGSLAEQKRVGFHSLKLFHRPNKPPPEINPDLLPESVEISLKVKPTGMPSNLVIKGTLPPLAEQWVRNYVASWRFIPTMRNGSRENGTVNTTLRFK